MSFIRKFNNLKKKKVEKYINEPGLCNHHDSFSDTSWK